MERHKLDLLCLLNDVNSSICKIKDEEKLKNCEKKVKDIHSYLKRKKRKTARKSRKKKNITNSFPMTQESNTSEPLVKESTMDESPPTPIQSTAPELSESDIVEPSVEPPPEPPDEPPSVEPSVEAMDEQPVSNMISTDEDKLSDPDKSVGNMNGGRFTFKFKN
jgi:hypothetical protein